EGEFGGDLLNFLASRTEQSDPRHTSACTHVLECLFQAGGVLDAAAGYIHGGVDDRHHARVKRRRGRSASARGASAPRARSAPRQLRAEPSHVTVHHRRVRRIAMGVDATGYRLLRVGKQKSESTTTLLAPARSGGHCRRMSSSAQSAAARNTATSRSV